MSRELAWRSVLITACLLLGLSALGNSQSGKRRPQESAGLTIVPDTPALSC